uniref:E3 UFM1-protein ligase 1 homolog n=1 Tax=Romanomermis culicivorax TaxID=13658 RepID=A0A915K3M2_ROMCU
MVSWEEIKKLAADLHRVQLGDSAKRLSDRNCIEVIANLIERHLINVVFSLDGKEYVTRDYLKTQIINETLANGGRIALFDLQQILNVDYQTIEIEAKQIADNNRSHYSLCLGQLISRDYFEKICSEVNEKLEECGRLTLSDITKCYDLPMDALIAEITQQLGRKIKATLDTMDNGVLYTQDYMELQASIIRGALSAVTK